MTGHVLPRMRITLVLALIVATASYGVVAATQRGTADSIGIAYIAVVVSLHLVIRLICRREGRPRD